MSHETAIKTLRIHDSAGTPIALKVNNRKIIAANLDGELLLYAAELSAASVEALVDSSGLTHADVRHVPFLPSLTATGLQRVVDKDVADFCHFDNPYIVDWLLNLRLGDGTPLKG